METLIKKIKYQKKSDIFYLVPIGDIHLGNAGCDEERLGELIKWIEKTENVMWLGMGDLADCIVSSDAKRFDIETIADWLYKSERIQDIAVAQFEKLEKMFAPIAHKCLGLLYGNHEKEILKRHHIDLIRNLCQSLNVENLGYEAMIRLSFEQKLKKGKGHSMSHTIHAEHGYGGGRRPGAKINKIDMRDLGYDADIYLMGHVHEKGLVVGRKIYLPTLSTGYDIGGIARPKVKYKKILKVLTSCFLDKHIDSDDKIFPYERGPISYPEVGGYNPPSQGAVRLDFQMHDGDVHVRM